MVLHTEFPSPANNADVVARPVLADSREQLGKLRRQYGWLRRRFEWRRMRSRHI